jgi:hypothetical protein
MMPEHKQPRFATPNIAFQRNRNGGAALAVAAP